MWNEVGFQVATSVCKVRHVTPQFADPQVLRKLEPGIGQELLPSSNQMFLNNCVYKTRSGGVADYPESTLWGKSAAAADVIEEEVTSTVQPLHALHSTLEMITRVKENGQQRHRLSI